MPALAHSVTCSVAQGPFGNHDTAIPEHAHSKNVTSDSNNGRNTQLNEARKICHDLMNGKEPVHVVHDTKDLMSYAIGAMIAKLAKEKLLNDVNEAFAMLKKVFTQENLGRKKAYRLNRRTVFDSLQEFNLIKSKLSINKAKPGGTLPNIAEICSTIEKYKYRNITRAQIQSPNRRRDIVDARFHAMWVMRYVCGYSLSHIGKRLHDRDHTTVLNGVRKIRETRQKDAGDRETIDNICDECDILALRRHYETLTAKSGIRRIK